MASPTKDSRVIIFIETHLVTWTTATAMPFGKLGRMSSVHNANDDFDEPNREPWIARAHAHTHTHKELTRIDGEKYWWERSGAHGTRAHGTLFNIICFFVLNSFTASFDWFQCALSLYPALYSWTESFDAHNIREGSSIKMRSPLLFRILWCLPLPVCGIDFSNSF